MSNNYRQNINKTYLTMREIDAISLPQIHPLPRLTAHLFFSFFSESFGSPPHFHYCHCPLREISSKNKSHKHKRNHPTALEISGTCIFSISSWTTCFMKLFASGLNVSPCTCAKYRFFKILMVSVLE